MTITLDPQTRGDPFSYSSVLTGDWVESMFVGGFFFTLRTIVPPSSVVTDAADSPGFVDQATSEAGEITFQDATHFTVTFTSPRTTKWPRRKLFWDFAGKISDDNFPTLASGEIQILGDVTRRP